MDRTTLDPEIKHAREELGRLLNDLISQPLYEETRRIADDNLYQLKNDINAKSGTLRRKIDEGFTATNDDIGDALGKLRSSILKVSNEFSDAVQQLESMEQLLNNVASEIASSEERLTKLLLAQSLHNTTSFKAISALQSTQHSGLLSATEKIVKDLDALKHGLYVEYQSLQRTQKVHSLKLTALLGLSLMTGIVISFILFKLFMS